MNMDSRVKYTLILIHSLNHSFSHSFKYLLSIYKVPDTVLDAENTTSNKIKFLPSLKLYSGECNGEDGDRDYNKKALLFFSNLILGKSLHFSKL